MAALHAIWCPGGCHSSADQQDLLELVTPLQSQKRLFATSHHLVSTGPSLNTYSLVCSTTQSPSVTSSWIDRVLN